MPAWLAAFLASAIGTGLARAYALRVQLLDHPGDDRRNHVLPTPRGGGIAMAAVLAIMLAALAVNAPASRPMWIAWWCALLAVGIVGAWDDHRALSVRTRLGVHVLAALAVASGAWLWGWPIAIVLLSLVAVPVLVNFWNFMDGIDGIAASQAAIVALAAASLLHGDARLLAFVVAGVSLGFLPWNFPRARIFMGDAGSGTLGLMIACLWAACAAESMTHGLLLLFPMAAFLVDAGMTLLARMRAREAWWQAHSRHSYQVAARRWGRHWPVTLIYVTWSLVGVAFGWRVQASANIFIMLCLAAWYTATVIGWMRLRAGGGAVPTRSAG